MKRLIMDRVARMWLWWLLIGVFHFMAGAFMTNTLKSGSPFWTFVLWANPSMMLADLNQGYRRVALTLPFTKQQLGRAIWWSTTGFICLLTIGCSFLGYLCRVGDKGSVTTWVIYCASWSLLYGALSWCFNNTTHTRKKSPGWRIVSRGRWIRGPLALGLYALVYAALRNGFVNSYWVVLLFVVAFGLTVLGWLDAENFMTPQEKNPSTASTTPRRITAHQAPTCFGGVRYLLTTTSQGSITCTLLTGLLIFLLWAGLTLTHYERFTWHDLQGIVIMVQVMAMFWLLRGQFMMITHIRCLRTLPLSAKQLAALLLGVALLPWSAAAAMFSTGYWLSDSAAMGLLVLETYWLGIGCLCVLVVAAVWHQEKRFALIVGLAFSFALAAFPPFYHVFLATGRQGTGLPLWQVIGYPLLVGGLSWMMLCRLLERNSLTYHIRAEDLRGMAGQVPKERF